MLNVTAGVNPGLARHVARAVRTHVHHRLRLQLRRELCAAPGRVSRFGRCFILIRTYETGSPDRERAGCASGTCDESGGVLRVWVAFEYVSA